MPEGRDTARYGNIRADRAGPYFAAGTEGQEFEGHVGANEYLGLGSPEGNAEGKRRQSEGAVKRAREGENYPESWHTDSPDRLSVPASKVLGHIGHTQLMIDASSTGGGESDSHLLDFTTTEDSMKEISRWGKATAEGKRNPHTGKMQWSMYPAPAPRR